MKTRLAICFLAVVCLTSGAAKLPAPWTLSDAAGRTWQTRLKQAVARDGWSVSRSGAELTITRDAPVEVTLSVPNSPPDAVPRPDGTRKVKFVLRFAAPLSLDEYDRLSAINADSERKQDELRRAVGVSYKFDEFSPTTDEEKQRVQKYRETVAQLPRHELPEFYSTEHSVHFFHAEDGWSTPADPVIAAECHAVREGLMRLFGMYNPGAAAGHIRVGRALP